VTKRKEYSSKSLAAIRSSTTEFRTAILRTDGGGLVVLKDFPHGACGDASILLGQYLLDQELGEWTYVSGSRSSDQQTHAWIEKDGLIADITADQFDDIDEPVSLTYDPSWHLQFIDRQCHAARIDVYDDQTQRQLARAYQDICGRLAGP
jgi:hypothetical protein